MSKGGTLALLGRNFPTPKNRWLPDPGNDPSKGEILEDTTKGIKVQATEKTTSGYKVQIAAS